MHQRLLLTFLLGHQSKNPVRPGEQITPHDFHIFNSIWNYLDILVA